MKKAVMFPGQGAQSVGMGKDLYDTFPECAALFDQANDVLGFDLKTIIFEGPAEELTKSNITQPAIFVVSMAAYTALKLKNPELTFDAAAGHSLGEWAALCVAGVISFEDGLKALKARGEFIQEACEANPGGMLAVIGLDDDKVKAVAEEAGIYVANFNSPGQVVCSGLKEGIEKAAVLAKEAGAKRALPLAVAGAFHSPLMNPAAEKMAAFLNDIELNEPQIPVLSNVTGAAHADVAAIRENMVNQITGSVLWVDDVKWMREQGIDTFVECGPGKVLNGLIKRIDRGCNLFNIETSSDLEKVEF
ncbi:ACP S-malonyltransferase [Verrucomicrobiota bacterium]